MSRDSFPEPLQPRSASPLPTEIGLQAIPAEGQIGGDGAALRRPPPGPGPPPVNSTPQQAVPIGTATARSRPWIANQSTCSVQRDLAATAGEWRAGCRSVPPSPCRHWPERIGEARPGTAGAFQARARAEGHARTLHPSWCNGSCRPTAPSWRHSRESRACEALSPAVIPAASNSALQR